MANNVDPSAQTQLSAPAGKIPIIIVPGIMGSRLEDSSGKRIWNPMGRPTDPMAYWDPGAVAADKTRLFDRQPLLPGKIAQNDVGFMSSTVLYRCAPIYGIYSCILDFYGELAWALHEQLPGLLKERGSTLVAKVYVAGYDWRQSNADSANTHLAPMVTRALAETGAEQVVLVAHSMGGLVARYYARNNPSKVGAYIALASPHLGAPQPFTRLKQGVVKEKNYDDISMWFLSQLLDLSSQWEGAMLLRSFPSMYQLMANRHYFALAKDSWLTFAPEHAGYPHAAEEGGQGSPPGGIDIYDDLFAGLNERAWMRPETIVHLDAAYQFHEALTEDGKPFLPPNSYCVYTNDLPTQVHVHVPAYGRIEQRSGANEYWGFSEDTFFGGGDAIVEVETGDGDSAVPVASAFPQSTSRPFVASQALSGAYHGSVPVDPDAIEAVLGWVTDLYVGK
ncbi:MAG: alpha/beta fold hydrolase [Polyangiaceae bacterium]|jgi:pimeloyl-ACP methyl ester carboxylesterase|nr:alpha/beta fold hydrolase [Polyangiaceae bacterium]